MKPYDSEAAITVSAIICTHNGARVLEKAISSLRNQDYPDNLYEIIVVDNASTDETPDVVAKVNRSGGKQVRYVEEPRLGLSHARNAGVRAAESDLVAFIDDDALADEGWLSGLVRVYAEHDAACVGGKVVPIWSASRPRWLPEELHISLTIVDMGDETRQLFGLEYPAGTNVSFSKAALDHVGAFDPSLGRRGELLLSGEEDELCSRLEKAGYKRFYTPHAVVHHVVPASRLNKRWLMRRAYWQGRTSAVRRSPRILIGEAQVSASP